MNTLVQINDSLAHAPAGVIAMLFAIAMGYMLKVTQLFPNNRIPLVVLPGTAVLYALIQLCEDELTQRTGAWLYFLLNFALGFIYGFIAWLLHAQLLKRFVDPKLFNDNGSTKFITKADVAPKPVDTTTKEP